MRKYFLRNLPPLIVAAAAVLFASFGRQHGGDGRFVVERVLDGDTVALKGGRAVRYIGIDTPETHKRTKEGWQEVHEPYGQEARRANEGFVLGKDVRLEFDVQKTDKYQRLLAYCFVSGAGQEIFVQAELLRMGLAYLYTFPPNLRYVDKLVEAQKEAREKKRGVWSQDLDIVSRDAARFLGRHQFVSGVVLKTRATQKAVRLLMEGLVVVIFKKDLGLFERSGIAPLSATTGKKIRVFGLIKSYRGDTEVIVSHPSQIEIINNP